MTFRIGQKVVRIGGKSNYDASCGCDGWPSCIKVGGIYTVRDVDTRAADFGWPIVLRFEEYIAVPWDSNCPGLEVWEPGFPGDCFRPVTDISFAHEILRSVSQKERA